MSVAIPIPLLQNLPDVNVSLGVGVDENMLVYDHATGKFVLRAPAAPFAGLLATGATVGATAQAQAFTLGVVSPFSAPAADSTTAWQVRKADGTTPVATVDTTNERVGIGTNAPSSKLGIYGSAGTLANGVGLEIQTGSVGDDLFVNFTGSLPGAPTKIARIVANANSGWGGNLRFQTSVDDGAYQDRLTILESGNVGINDTAPAEALDVTGNINATGVYKVDDVQVLSNRVIDARCADVANSGDATTDGLIDALRDAMVAHGLIAASA